MKKIIALFFLVIFLFNSLGYFVVFKYNQLEARKQMHAQTLANTANSKLVCISVSPEQKKSVAWTEENEFNYKGNLYDVVRSEIKSDGSITYYCMNDSKEEELFGKLDEHLNNQIDGSKTAPSKTSKVLLKLFAFDYFRASEKMTFYLQERSVRPARFLSSLISLPTEITTPPPRIA